MRKILFSLRTVLCSAILFISFFASAQSVETFTSGSVIIDMGGGTSPTIGNSIKPYGLLYTLLKDYNVPLFGVIGQTKGKDGIDFTYNGKGYKGGTYIIASEFRTAQVNTLLANWAAKGVLIDYTTSSLTLNTTYKLTFAPRFVMDKQNGYIAVAFLTSAGIPASAYSFKDPSQLADCDDIFVMPHADPTWATHNRLYFWNKSNKGAIWAGCHAPSVLEGLTKDTTIGGVSTHIQMNFLSTKGLVSYALHKGAGTLPYTHQYPTDPMSQYIGSTDASQLNGSEQIFMPLKTGSWNPGVKIITQGALPAYIPSLSNGPAAVNLYGRAFDDPTRGLIFYEGAHNVGINGTVASEVASQRMFFDFCFYALRDKAITSFNVALSGIATEMKAGTTYTGLTATATGGGPFTYQWKSSVAGTFSNPTGSTTSFTPSSTISASTPANITCVVTDACGRGGFDSKGVVILPANPPISAANIC